MNMIIRGIPEKLHKKIMRWAKTHDLSMNQATLKWLMIASGDVDKQEKERKQRDRVFERIDQIRESIRSKYPDQDDSAEIIRWYRDHRYGIKGS